MTIATKIDGFIIVITISGQIELGVLAEFIIKNIDSWNRKPVLWDMTATDLRNISDQQIIEFAKSIASPDAKRSGAEAAIVAPEDLQFGLARMYKIFAEFASTQIIRHVFRTIAEAKSWLLDENHPYK